MFSFNCWSGTTPRTLGSVSLTLLVSYHCPLLDTKRNVCFTWRFDGNSTLFNWEGTKKSGMIPMLIIQASWGQFYHKLWIFCEVITMMMCAFFQCCWYFKSIWVFRCLAMLCIYYNNIPQGDIMLTVSITALLGSWLRMLPKFASTITSLWPSSPIHFVLFSCGRFGLSF